MQIELNCIVACLDVMCYAVLFSDVLGCDVPCIVSVVVLCGVVCLLRCHMNSDERWCVLHSGELCCLS